jgi:hypothetical protein
MSILLHVEVNRTSEVHVTNLHISSGFFFMGNNEIRGDNKYSENLYSNIKGSWKRRKSQLYLKWQLLCVLLYMRLQATQLLMN